ncbi:MAG: bifunctional phosphopantothenoylcysteine decarboxylase/phosphopantothenate--cysteine ligase CoaBC [Acidithiobacillus sp.]|nr:bifunctional phosphopantothenoylcysteine decarboxylase/phosphopantothenate--cysteine ligase CoaBC [Acidithiobacillus sp.]
MNSSETLPIGDPLAGQKILLCIGGSIAAYKSPELVRLLLAAGAKLKIVLSPGASHFVTPLTLQALLGEPPRQEFFTPSEEAAMDHIRLARWADALLFAPISANGLARLALGLADDLRGAIALASRAPRFLVPAMNSAMWEHPATQRHVHTLQADGGIFLGPEQGSLACGEEGPGRMLSPEAIVDILRRHLGPKPWQGRKILITAGPTWESWDPVRGLSNRASGRQGFALAQAAAELGATVQLISGPVALPTPVGISRQDVLSAQEMLAAVQKALAAESTDLFIANAAVADHRPALPVAQKQPKGTLPLHLELSPNPDIVATIARSPHRPRKILAFAAETHGDEAHAKAKLEAKGADFAFLNLLDPGVLGGSENAGILWAGQQRWEFSRRSKLALARGILQHLQTFLS